MFLICYNNSKRKLNYNLKSNFFSFHCLFVFSQVTFSFNNSRFGSNYLYRNPSPIAYQINVRIEEETKFLRQYSPFNYFHCFWTLFFVFLR